MSGSLYVAAVLIFAILRTLGLDRQISHGIHVSDLVGDIALALGVGLCCRLGWSVARTQPIRAGLDATQDAVSVAALIITLTEMTYVLAFHGREFFTTLNKLFPQPPHSLPAIVMVVGGEILAFLVIWVLVWLSIAILGCLICIPSVLLLHRFVHPGTVPTD
jgi:hypothetical protein